VVEHKAERWPIDRLKRSERQDANFHDLSDLDLRLLADDMEANGQTTPIEVRRDGTIIDGHQRLRAARLLHWPEVQVWVRDDLKGKRAAERRMLEANLNRRQLHTLDRIRIAKRSLELDQWSRSGELSPSQEQGLTADLSEKLGMGRRNVRRWLAVLKAPMVVQRAAQEGRLPLVDAERVSRMDAQTQQRIADAIARGEDPKLVVGEAAKAKDNSKPADPSKEFGRFIDFAEERLDTLEIGLDSIQRGSSSERDLEVIKRLESLLKSAKPVLAKQARRSRKAEAEFTSMAAKLRRDFMRG
jgi:ParB/RepB/Spo0J family partition protein